MQAENEFRTAKDAGLDEGINVTFGKGILCNKHCQLLGEYRLFLYNFNIYNTKRITEISV